MNKLYFYHLTNMGILLYFLVSMQSCGKIKPVEIKTSNTPKEDRVKEEQQDERLANVENELEQTKQEAETLQDQVNNLENTIQDLNQFIDEVDNQDSIESLQDQINERDEQLSILIAEQEETQEKLDMLELEFNALETQVNEEDKKHDHDKGHGKGKDKNKKHKRA